MAREPTTLIWRASFATVNMSVWPEMNYYSSIKKITFLNSSNSLDKINNR